MEIKPARAVCKKQEKNLFTVKFYSTFVRQSYNQ